MDARREVHGASLARLGSWVFTMTCERAVAEYSGGAGIERASLRRQLAECGDFLGGERAVPDGNVVEVAAQ